MSILTPDCQRIAAWARETLLLIVLLGSGVLPVVGRAADDVPVSDAEVSEREMFFEQKIRPVLIDRCYACHSAKAAASDELRGGLLVDDRAGLFRGGDSGPAVVPGDPDSSLLMQALRYESFEMPPEGRLDEQTLADFQRWIQDGAVDPRTPDPDASATPLEMKDGPSVTGDLDLEAARQHWAYRPLPSAPRPPPRVPEASTAVDAFILTRLREHSFEPLAEADRETLVRRLSFDLAGLPPTPHQIDAFVHDPSPDAYERLVDRLLAAPEFGERWGRHWLDVARWAESVTLRGLVQHEAWRYRDYVIEALNEDLPYDQFLIQQVAGDLSEADSLRQRQRNLVATTFLTLANANLEDQDKEKLRMDVVDEQLTVIGSALLGQTIGCARCHDHKFDPIPTRDYYALAGILRNTRTLEHANVSRWIERPLPVAPEHQRRIEAHRQEVAAVEQQIRDLEAALGITAAPRAVPIDSLPGIVIDDDQAELVGVWQTSQSVRPFVGNGYRHDGNAEQGQKQARFSARLPKDGRYEVRLAYTAGANRGSNVVVAITTAEGVREMTIDQRRPGPIAGMFVSLGTHAFTADAPASVAVSNHEANGHVVIDAVQFLPEGTESAVADAELSPERGEQLAAELEQAKQSLQRLQRNAPTRPQYMAVEEEPRIEEPHVLIRGNVHQQGEPVQRGFLSVVSYGAPPAIPDGQSGRLQLGHWLANPHNPLPARVMANRLWHWLFGEGLVRTPDNLGHTGAPPTHPELLDYLAAELVAHDWSIKHVVRQIVLSDAYRRGSDPRDSECGIAQDAQDPENRWLWRANRRRLEAECLLDAVLATSGQLSRQMGGKTIPDGLAADYGFHHNSVRRAVYWPALRNATPELVEVFDGANPSLVTGRRNVSSVAPQALFLMNNPWLIEQSEHAARRLLAEDHATDKERLTMAFRRVLGRVPSAAERDACEEFLEGSSDDSDRERQERWSRVMQSLYCTIDFRYLY